MAEWSSYTHCLRYIGGSGDAVAKRYYGYGFSNITATCGPTGATNCLYYVYSGTAGSMSCAAGDGQFPQTAKVSNGTAMVTAASQISDGVVAQTTFVVDARGNVSVDVISDQWIIDQNKNLYNKSPGI